MALLAAASLWFVGCAGSGSFSSQDPSQASPVANAGGPYTANVGQSITFDGSKSTVPTGQTLTYAWSFGDGGTGTGIAPAHSFATAGAFTVTLTVTASSGKTATAIAAAAIAGLPVANAGGPYTANVGQSITFDGSKSTAPAGQTITYAWTFGDGSSGTGVSPSHTYTTAGAFAISLTVTSSSGATASATASATIAGLPVANAGGPYTANVGQSITFDGSKSTAPAGQTITYAWTFGDGSTGTGVSPTHTYTTAGAFAITLTVTSSSGATASATATATIAGLPVANAGGPYTANVGQSITFDGSKSTAPAGQTITYAWTFGDGSSGTGVSPSHTYTTAGAFAISLTVTSSSGATASATATATIAGLPVANAGGPYTANVGQSITFDGSKSTAPAGQTITYAWTFGDGSTGTGASPTHSYATAGAFAVVLSVTASGGSTATSSATATIAALPVANAGGPYAANAGQNLSFDASKSTAPAGQTLTYAWNFGDGSTGTGVSPVHTYAVSGSFTVTLTVTGTSGGTATATAIATIAALPVANAGGPYSATAGQPLTFDGSKSTVPAGQTLTYAWVFGDGSAGSGIAPVHTYATAGTYTATLTVTSSAGAKASASANVTIAAATVAPTILSFTPSSGTIGTLVTVTGTNFTQGSGSVPQIAISQLGGGTLTVPLTNYTATSLAFVIPAGGATGPLTVVLGSQSATSAASLTITPSSTFTLAVTPASASLIQGQSTVLAVTVNSTNGFTGSATLAVSGLPAGVTGSFSPASIGVGQIGLLTLTAPAGQSSGTATLAFTATATIDAAPFLQTASASLQVNPVSTTFLGRTVVDDATETPISGVTISFLGQDGSNRATGCTGQAVSDGGGNFALSNLPPACTGPQLISYDGSTAKSPAGKYAGVNLSYTITAGQVKSSPVLVHLPRVDNAEMVQVQQNSKTDQIFAFTSMPGVKVTVYAGTTIALADGSTPNPFPLVAMSIPIDRLPEQMPTTGILMPFIVAFQPANAFANQPVAVNFPNLLNTAPGTHVTFMTLDPTHGYMVPYGTGTASNDGTQFVADADPAHPGHGYGLVHFDWHGPAVPPLPPTAPSHPAPACDCPSPSGGDPVDIATGIVSKSSADVQIGGGRGGLRLARTYHTLSAIPGPFGIGSASNYSTLIDVSNLVSGGVGGLITLVLPDGSQYPFVQTGASTFANTTIPLFRGATITGGVDTNVFTLKMLSGSQLVFQRFVATRPTVALLTSLTDPNGNTTTLTLDSSAQIGSLLAAPPVLKITDPVGRSLTLAYDSFGHVLQVTDPIGRKLIYAYTAAGYLSSFTNATGGVTSYTYDAKNNLASVTDPRGVVVEQNTYNTAFDNRLTQQVQADGGIFQFAYTLQNPQVANSPVLQTVVTDPMGNATTYRFDMQGFLLSVADASGQTRNFTHDPNHSNRVSDYTGNGHCAVCGDPLQGDRHYTFDQYGNPVTVTDGAGYVTRIAYNALGQPVSLTDPMGATETAQYDSSGNLTSMTDFNGNTMQMVYDQFGQLVQSIDAGGGKAIFTYDGFGNIISTTSALGTSSASTYDAVSRITQDQDELGRKTQFVYDALDRITSLVDPKGGKQQYTYDAVGDVLTVTDAAGNLTSYVFDPLERLTKQTAPTGASTRYAYDSDSNLKSVTDRRGLTTTFGYDALNRRVSTAFADSTMNIVYEPAGGVASVTDSMDGTFTFQHDARGELVQQAGPTGVVQYKRDAVARVLSEQVDGQGATSYTYDPNGRVISATMGNAGVTYAYDPRGLPTSLTRTNGVVSSFTYDGLGQVTSIAHKKGATVLNTQSFQYDPAGQRTTVANDLSQAITTPSSTSTMGTGNQLTASSATTYTYDANGNRLTETTAGLTTTYSWDARNRLTSIVDGSGNKTSMTYAMSRALLGITHPAGSVPASQVFVEDVNENAVLQTNDGSTVSVLAGRVLDSTFASVSQTGAATFPIGDGLGSPIASTDGSGTLSAKVSYDPFGVPTGTPSAQLPLVFGNHFAVQGNILYNHARYYDTGKGRFLSEDPLGFGGGDSNLYRFAANNPINLVDPSGLYGYGLSTGAQAEVGIGGIGAAAGGEFGVGDYFDQDKGYRSTSASYASAALFLGGPQNAVGYPKPDTGSGDFVLGATIPIPGVSAFVTNARGRLDELGVFDQYSITFAIFTLNLGIGSGCRPGEKEPVSIWHLSFTGGEKAGFQISHHKTNTFLTYQTGNHSIDTSP